MNDDGGGFVPGRGGDLVTGRAGWVQASPSLRPRLGAAVFWRSSTCRSSVGEVLVHRPHRAVRTAARDAVDQRVVLARGVARPFVQRDDG
jgi:hypothetical protein